MGDSMTAVYLVAGLLLVGLLYYVLTQITARQRRLNAELTRLERLAAEVSMNAEAILERVDERIDRLNELTTEVEQRMSELRAAAANQSAAPALLPNTQPAAAAPGMSEPKAEEAPKQRKPRKRAAQEVATVPAEPPAAPVEEPATPEDPTNPTSLQRYQQLRVAVSSMADQGKSAAEIAQELGVPRGEVQLILNLRGRKVTA